MSNFPIDELAAVSYLASMIRATYASKKAKVTRFHGICRAAETLGVTRVHLYLVLTGKRESRILKRRYAEYRKGLDTSEREGGR